MQVIFSLSCEMYLCLQTIHLGDAAWKLFFFLFNFFSISLWDGNVHCVVGSLQVSLQDGFLTHIPLQMIIRTKQTLLRFQKKTDLCAEIQL